MAATAKKKAKLYAKGITSQMISDLLRKRYAAPAWAYLEEVRNATGYASARTADGLAMSLWPSRGLEVHGFEIKVTRSDVKSELGNPDKAREIMQYCDRWWLVLGAEQLIQPGELPPTWGLMVVRGTTQLRAVTEAPKLDAKPLNRRFVASVMRNFEQTYVPSRLLRVEENNREKLIAEAIEERAGDEIARKIRTAEQRAEYAQQSADSANETLKKWQEVVGCRIDQWSLGDLTDALNLVRRCGTNSLRRNLKDLETRALQAAEFAKAGIEQLDQVEVSDA